MGAIGILLMISGRELQRLQPVTEPESKHA
jgi:hypothetical protein